MNINAVIMTYFMIFAGNYPYQGVFKRENFEISNNKQITTNTLACQATQIRDPEASSWPSFAQPRWPLCSLTVDSSSQNCDTLVINAAGYTTDTGNKVKERRSVTKVKRKLST